MILSSYLRELSVEANKRRNNNNELLKLVPTIQYQSSKIQTLTEKKVFPKKEIKMKKKKGLIEIVEKEEKPKKNDKVEQEADIQEGGDIVVVEAEEQIGGDNITNEEEEQIGGDIVVEEQLGGDNITNEKENNDHQEGGKDIKKIVITESAEGSGDEEKEGGAREVKKVIVTSFF